MADKYIDRDYVKARLGGNFVDAVDQLEDVSIDAICEDATAEMQTLLRKAGYQVPTPTTTDRDVMNGCVWLVWTQVAQMPDSSIELPKYYSDNMYYMSLKGIKDGSSALTLPYLPSDPLAGAQLIGDRVI
jgi:hypothetical protein